MKQELSRGWLVEIRNNKGMTQQEMAKFLSVPLTTYASYEQGYRTPHVEVAKKLGNRLHVDWTLFFENKVRRSSIK